jgi:hypothetical protein
MSSLFGSKPKYKPPPPVAPPPPPVREDAQASVENQADMLRRRRGRASTVLTDGTNAPLGESQSPTTAAAKVLGS